MTVGRNLLGVLFISLSVAFAGSCSNDGRKETKDKLASNKALDQASTSFGQYFGVLTHEQLGTQQLAKLQIISVRGENNTLLLQAILTLHFGDVRSGEYLTYHYENLRYDPISGKLTFDQEDQKLTITTVKFDGVKFIGEVRVDSSYVGKLELSQTNAVTPTMPLVGPLWGEYKASCEGKQKILQMQTLRSTVDTHRTGDPFAAYQISGQLAEKNSPMCGPDSPGGQNPDCVTASYFGGSYNFFRASLTLFSAPRNDSCFVDKGTVICGECRFQRSSDEVVSANKTYTWPESVDAFESDVDEEQDDLSSIDGEYTGYIFHEYLNVYQPVKMSFVTYQDSGANDGSLRLSAVATSFFGGFETAERLIYRFSEKPFPILTSEFMLDRTDADLDARLKVTRYGSNQIKGIWYSKLFGRVGEFMLSKQSAPDLPTGSKIIPSVAGVYKSSSRLLNLGVGLGEAPVNTNNPFYPLVFNGYLWPLDGSTARIPLLSGSYDFYTGKLGFVLDGGNQFLLGQRTFDGTDLYLKKTPKKMALVLQSHDLDKFELAR